MKTIIINHQQGSEAWHQHRARSLNASELAAVMGMSGYISRSELIKQKVTKIILEIDAHTQRRFDAGHEFEAIARPWAEEIIGSDLYPVVLAGEADGLNLSASLDGLTMTDISWEHKTGRADLLASLDYGVIPDEYHPQMEMGLMLSGAEKCLFMASSGDKDAMRWAWYLPNPELRAKIIPTWVQFALDLAAYSPIVTDVKPIGKTFESLPALSIQVTGMVTHSNIEEFKANAIAAIDSVRDVLKTDQDFADNKKAIKWLKEVESRTTAAAEGVVAQAPSIDEVQKILKYINEVAKAKRLDLEKKDKTQTESLKGEIVAGGVAGFRDHIASLNKRLGRQLMPVVLADFGAAVKGKSSFDSMREAVATTLANAKVAANLIADCIEVNLGLLLERENVSYLFADSNLIVLKATDDLKALIAMRVSEHDAKEAARVSAMEAAKAATVAAQDAIEKAATTPAPAQTTAAPAVEEVHQPYANAPVSHEPAPSIKLGVISERIGLPLTGDLLASLGFQHFATEKSAKLYRESDFLKICDALLNQIQTAKNNYSIHAVV